jgi:hypothetical protein
MGREAHRKNKKMVCVGVGVTTNKTNVPVVKTREENKSERMHPECKKNTSTYLVGGGKEKKTKVKSQVSKNEKKQKLKSLGV